MLAVARQFPGAHRSTP